MTEKWTSCKKCGKIITPKSQGDLKCMITVFESNKKGSVYLQNSNKDEQLIGTECHISATHGTHFHHILARRWAFGVEGCNICELLSICKNAP